MMEIEFRGITSDGEWEYGGVVINPRGQYFITTFIGGSVVDPETVGQYTGLLDKNGKKIYKDDIVKTKDISEKIGVVKFGKHKATDMSNDYECGNLGFYIDFNDELHLLRQDIYFWHGLGIEVIGNIYENKEPTE